MLIKYLVICGRWNSEMVPKISTFSSYANTNLGAAVKGFCRSN